jgi:hypothetical protein
MRGQHVRGSVHQTSHALCGSVRETLILLYVIPSDESIGPRAGGQWVSCTLVGQCRGSVHAGGQSIKHHMQPRCQHCGLHTVCLGVSV